VLRLFDRDVRACGPRRRTTEMMSFENSRRSFDHRTQRIRHLAPFQLAVGDGRLQRSRGRPVKRIVPAAVSGGHRPVTAGGCGVLSVYSVRVRYGKTDPLLLLFLNPPSRRSRRPPPSSTAWRKVYPVDSAASGLATASLQSRTPPGIPLVISHNYGQRLLPPAGYPPPLTAFAVRCILLVFKVKTNPLGPGRRLPGRHLTHTGKPLRRRGTSR
jgi:hypothetical protein